MAQTFNRWSLALAVAVASVIVAGNSTANAGEPRHFVHRAGVQVAECQPYVYGQPDLFANYYSPPVCGGVGASLYVSPIPVPPHVGHTYITYQPLMPHEMMYHHHKTYHRYYDDGRGLTRTHVSWYCPPGKATWSHIHQGLKLAR